MAFLQANRPYAQNTFCSPDSLSYSVLNSPMMHYGSHNQTYQPATTRSYFGPEVISNPIVFPVKQETKPVDSSKIEEPSLPKASAPTPIEWDIPTLPNAAIFRPTEEEFRDPMKYIASIKEEGQKYGICKIIPPSDKWLQGRKMTDLIDPKTFLFPTKVQNIHQLQTRNGPCSRFMEDLEKFLEKKKTPMKNIPVIDGHELDLYKLYRAVVSRGGMDQVSIAKKWTEIARELRVSEEFSNAGHAIKQNYEKFLYAYEQAHRARDLNTKQASPSVPIKEKKGKEKKEKKEKKKKDPEESDEDDFGYADGRMYTMNQFKKMANFFKRKFFPTDEFATPEQIEKMYWKLVETSEEAVRVHYGSDVDVGVYGSGFPNSSDELRRASGWNLNKFATEPGSILQFLNESISGVVRPMMYIGMLFSSFCWHTEDNYLYSINYLHHGSPKTWYGIPAYAAEEFERVMKATVPELFEQNPNLLFCLVTQLSPRILVSNGVPVYTALQQPGEFMITFPKGYHAGFSHGFNCAESCNFALDDWFPFGKECLERYRNYGRSSVLSIEKLLCSAARSIYGPLYIRNLKEELLEMRNREVFLREKVLLREGVWKSVHFDNWADEKDVVPECTICKYDCYLSGVVCPCSPEAVVCLRHSEQMCECEASRKHFLFRYKVDQLDELLLSVDVAPEELVPQGGGLTSLASTTRFGKGHVGKKIHQRLPLSGITKPAIRRLGRRAGMQKVKGVNYIEKNPLLSDGMYIMESIISSRTVHGRTEYLIKWENRPTTEGSWVDLEDLCCAGLIDLYKYKGKKREAPKTRSSNRVKTRKMGRMMMS